MANDEVLEQGLHLRRKSRNRGNLCLQHFEFNNHVAEQLPAAGVRKRASIGQLVNLSNVMQKRSCEKQIAIDLRVVSRDQVTGAKQRNHMVQQTAYVCVMERLRCRSAAISDRDLGISH